jgi:uncharacterized protein (DUF4415 family)
MASDRYAKSDNPSWTDADFKRARPISEVLPPDMQKLLVRPKGRPAVDPIDHKQAVSIRLDREIITHFKVDGPGWQTRINDVLKAVLKDADKQAGSALRDAMERQRGDLATQKEVSR